MAWTEDETKALLRIWADEKIQNQLEGQKRNKVVFNRIAAELLATAGVSRTWQQCKVKIKNLVQKYRKIKDVYGVSGRGRVPFVFYDDIDAVLGTRAATEPPVLLQSGAAETEVKVGIEESLAAEVAENPFQSTEESGTAGDEAVATISTVQLEVQQNEQATNIDNTEASTDSVNDITSNEPANESTPARAEKKQKSKKRKRENGENIREVMKSMEESFEKKWFEREEIRRKYEEEREKRIMEKEQEHEARMMSMFMRCVQQVLGHGSWTSTSIPAPHHQYASEPYHPLQNHGHTQIPTGHDQVPTSSGYSNYSLPPPTQ